jgi:hypothetical protein
VRVVGSGVLRAFPDSTWGARGWLEQIVIGAIDETGGLAGDAGPLAEPGGGAATTGAGRAGPRIIKVGGTGRVFAVLGTPDDGIIIGGGMHSLVLVRSRAGKLTADKPQLISQIAYSIDPTGRALVAYNDDGAFGAPLDVVPDPSTGNFGKLHAFVARGAAPARVVDLGETQVGGACFTARRGWIAAADSVQPEGAVPIVSFDLESGAAAPQALPEHDLIGCTADAALLQQRNTSRYAVCTDAGCRAASLPGMQPSKHAALAGDELVGIVHRDRVLGVWREKGPPRYFTVRAPLSSLQLALSDGKVLDVVAQSDAGAVIVRVPAR